MVYLTKQMESYLEKSVKFGYHFYTHPYKWTQNGPRLISPSKQVLWLGNLALLISYTVYLICQSIRMVQDKNMGVSSMILLLFNLLLTAYISVLQIAIILNKREFATMTSENRKLMATEGGPSSKSSRLVVKMGYAMMKGNYYASYVNFAMQMATIILRPNAPESLTSLLPAQSTWIAVVVATILQVYIGYIMWSFIILLALPFHAFVFPFLAALIDMKTLTVDMLWLQRYKSLKILSSIFNEVYNLIMSAAKTMLTSVVIFSFCAFVRKSGPIANVLGILSCDILVIVIIAFNGLAEFHHCSQKLIMKSRAQAQVQRRKDLRRIIRSLRPVVFEMGSCYIVDKRMVLTLLEFVIQATINVLLALKN